MEYSTAALYIAAKASKASQSSKKAYSSSSDKQALPAQWRCRNCGETRYNTYMCKKDKEETSKTDSRILYTSSLSSDK